MSFLAWLRDTDPPSDPAALIRAAGLDPEHYDNAGAARLAGLRRWAGASGPDVPPTPPLPEDAPAGEPPLPDRSAPPGPDDRPLPPPPPNPVYGPPPGPRRRWFGR